MSSVKIFSAEERARYRAQGYWGNTTVYGMFAATAERVPQRLCVVDPPDRCAIVHGDRRSLSYRDMSSAVDAVAESLREHGLGPGSLIASQLPNTYEVVLLYLAVAKIGAVVSPISLAYRQAELEALAAVVDFDAYVSVAAVNGKAFCVERIAELPASVKRFGFGPGLPAEVVRLDDGEPRTPQPAHDASADDLFGVFWTSGTEGNPKAVAKTHNNMMASSLGAWKVLSLPDGANVLAPFPFINAAGVSGLMMCWMRTAGTLVMHHPFNVDTFIQQLIEEDITYTMVAPTVLTYLRERSSNPELGSALRRLRAIGTGAAPPDPEVFEFFAGKFGVQVLNQFGSNEGAQMCSSDDTVAEPRKRARFFPRDGDVAWLAGAGRRTANGGVFRLTDPQTGAAVTEPGGIGEMFISGPAVMPGYFSRDGFDRSKFNDEGFFATADLFELSECGTLIRFHARARELIVRGGMKLSPVELDNFLAALPGVREVAVAPYSDHRLGERVCVCVVPRAGYNITLDSVIQYCSERGLAKFKWPERLLTLDELPRTPLAKLDRRALTRLLHNDAGGSEDY